MTNKNGDARLFNFFLPDELKKHLKTASKKEYSTISTYLIKIILEDKIKSNE